MGDARLLEPMGSKSSQEEITILVTGFGPFRAQYPVNPSWEIARSLPAYLPPLRAKDPRARSSSAEATAAAAAAATTTTDMPRVRILVHPEAIRVTYKNVRGLVPSLWDDAAHRIDACVHIGMASARPQYALERRAHRTGYLKPDVAGEFLEDELPGGRDGDWIWRGLPDELESVLNIPNIHLRWKELSSPDMDLRISDDPGRYLCDFIYYSSLATLYKQQRPGKVCFLHVPSDASDIAVERGRELAVNLIRAIAESEIADKRRAAK
ncbi:Peptidase C15, pyroglutamyl peptidase I-like protein [Beauveria brongniartii RCEF 3172]|uniref:Peptidase C15, pyroglutamyl peptidase I-like protein n=1 Tax=Beauveria brongniartii RCEF 3172 TaxID=1081107 RepID=A0A167DT92_9HYPO|nr:Peptidase C15, pyroglutamyl peptidase I-like protein [Beauveria brongniartii RCEF 3172]